MAATQHHEQASVMEAVLAHRQAVSDQYQKGKQQRVSASSANDDAVAEACLLRDQVVADNGSRLKMQEDIRFLRHQVDSREAKIAKITGENESLKCRNEQLKKMLREKDEGTYCLKVEIAQMKNQYDGLLEENINLARNLHELERDLGMGGIMMGASSFAESFTASTAPLSASFKSASLRRPSAVSVPAASAPPKDRFGEMMKDKTTIVTLRRKLREQRAVQMEVRRRAEMSTMEAEDQLSAFTGELSEFLYDEGCYNGTSTADSGDVVESDSNAPAYYNYSEGPMGRYIPLIRRIYMEGAEDDKNDNEATATSKGPRTNAEARASSGAPRLISFKSVKALGHHLEGSLFKQFRIALNQKFPDEHHLENSFKHSPFGQPLSSIIMELHRLIKDTKEQSELQVNSMFYIFDELEKRLTVTEQALVNQQGVVAASKTSGISIAGALGQLRRGSSSSGSIPSTSTLLRRDGSLANPRGDFVEEMKAHVQEFNSAMRRILVCVREGAKRVIGLEGAAKDEWLRKYHAQLQTKEIATQMNAEEIPDPKIGRLEERVEYLNNRMATITAEHSASLLEYQLQRDKAEVVTKFLQEKLFTLHDGVYECLHTVFKHRVQWISRLPNSFTHLYADIKRLGGESPIFTSVQFNTDVGSAVEEDTKLLRQFAHFFVSGDTYAAVGGGAASPLRNQRPSSALGGGCASPLGTRKANQRNLQQDAPGTPAKCSIVVGQENSNNNNSALEGSIKGGLGGQKTPIGVKKSSSSTTIANASFGSHSGSGSSMLDQLASTKPTPSTISTRKNNNNQQVGGAVNSTKAAIAAGKMVAEPQEFCRKKKEKIAMTKAEKQQKQLSVTMKKLLAEEQKAAALASPLITAKSGDDDGFVAVTTPLNATPRTSPAADTVAPAVVEEIKKMAFKAPPTVPSNAAVAPTTKTTTSKKPTPLTSTNQASSSKPSSAMTTPRPIMQPTTATAAPNQSVKTAAVAASPAPDTTTSLPAINNNSSRRSSLTLTATPPPSPLKQVGEVGGHFTRTASFANSSFCGDDHQASNSNQDDASIITTNTATEVRTSTTSTPQVSFSMNNNRPTTTTTSPPPTAYPTTDVSPTVGSISPPPSTMDNISSRLAPVDLGHHTIQVKSNPTSRSTSIDNGPRRDSSRPPTLLLDSITSGLTRKASAPTITPTASARQTPKASPRTQQPVAAATISEPGVSPSSTVTGKKNNNYVQGATPISSPRRNSASAVIGSSSRRGGSMTGSGRGTTAAFAPPVGGSRLQSAVTSANSSFAADSAKTTPRDTPLQAPLSTSSAAPVTRRRASTVTVACEYERMASWQRRQTELWQIRREENAKESKRGYESTIITAVDNNMIATTSAASSSSHVPTPPQTPNHSASAVRTSSNTRPSTTNPSIAGNGRVGGDTGALTPRTFSGPF